MRYAIRARLEVAQKENDTIYLDPIPREGPSITAIPVAKV